MKKVWSDSSQKEAVLVVGLRPLANCGKCEEKRQRLYLLTPDLQCDFSGHPSPVLWSCLRSTGTTVAELGLVEREASSFL